MRARDVVGCKILRVRQQRRYDTNSTSMAVEILGIDLDNGRTIYFSVTETDHGDGYIVEAGITNRRPKKPKAGSPVDAG